MYLRFFLVYLKDVSSAHQGYIYLIKNTVEFVKYYNSLKQLFSYGGQESSTHCKWKNTWKLWKHQFDALQMLSTQERNTRSAETTSRCLRTTEWRTWLWYIYQCLLWKMRFFFILISWSYDSLAAYIIIISLNKLMKYTIAVTVNVSWLTYLTKNNQSL